MSRFTFSFSRLRYLLPAYAVSVSPFRFPGYGSTDDREKADVMWRNTSYLNVEYGMARLDYHTIAKEPFAATGQANAISTHKNGYTVSIYCVLDNHYGRHATEWVSSRFGDRFAERWRNRVSTVPELHASAATPVAEEDLKPENLYPSAGEMEGLVKNIFLDIDDELVNQSAYTFSAMWTRRADNWEVKANDHQVPPTPSEVLAGLSGSSYLAVIWDSTTRLAHIANTGNSGVIFARRKTSGTGTSCMHDVEVLAPLPQRDDLLRVERVHPGEKDVVDAAGRLWGTVPLRVFGMVPWKWTNEIRKMVGWTGDSRFASNVQTPPYLTAEPVTASVRAEEGDVLILASSDTFPSSLSPKERFDLVHKCLTDPTLPATRQAQKEDKKTSSWAPPDHWSCTSQGFFSQPASHEYTTQNEDGLYEERNVARQVMESLGWTGDGQLVNEMKAGDAVTLMNMDQVVRQLPKSRCVIVTVTATSTALLPSFMYTTRPFIMRCFGFRFLRMRYALYSISGSSVRYPFNLADEDFDVRWDIKEKDRTASVPVTFSHTVVTRDEHSTCSMSYLNSTHSMRDCSVAILSVHDGHPGHSTTRWLEGRLPERICSRWWDLHFKTRQGFPSPYQPAAFHAIGHADGSDARGATPQEIANMMKRTFLELDNDLVNLSAHLASARLARRWSSPPNVGRAMDDPLLQAAINGCSAIVVLYDHITRLVHVANSGSNAGVILARPRDYGQQGVYDVEVLARPTAEDERQLRALHPGEDNLLGKDGMLRGSVPLRGFGHAPWKWTKEVRQMVGFTDLSHDAVTPPYVTAEPIMATVPIEDGDILILASRGVFPPSFSPEATVKLVEGQIVLQDSVPVSHKVMRALGWIVKNGDESVITDKVASGVSLSLCIVQFGA